MSNLENVQGRLKNLLDKVRPALIVTRRMAVVLLSMTFGFFVHKVYTGMKEKKCPAPAPKEVRVLKHTSVAINERNELMVIDRVTGTYETYDASVGRTIFTLYANQIYSNKTK